MPITALVAGDLASLPLVYRLPEEAVRNRIARELGRIGDPVAVEPLLGALARFHLIEADGSLLAFGEVRAVPLLVECLRDDFLRERAAAILFEFGANAVALAAPSAALEAVGIAAASMPVVTAGVVLALIEYALALRGSGAPLSVLTAVLVGVVLFLLVELADFICKTHGVVVTPPVLTTIVCHWLAVAGIGIALMMALVAGAGVMRLAARRLPYPAVAAVGALGATEIADPLIAILRNGKA